MQHKIGTYIRVSTEEQALRTEGSLDSQRHRLNGYVDIKNMQSNGWGSVVEHYIDDGFSAKDTNRPALQKLFNDLKKGKINTVLVTDISRLSRSIRDFCVIIDLFKDTKTKFLSLKEQFDTTTAAGEMMLFSMINLAQFERRQISERVSINFHSRAMRGLRNGGSPIIGYRIDPTNKSLYQVNKEEINYVQTIFNTYLSELSLYKTAAILREGKIPTKARESKYSASDECMWSTQLLVSTLRNHTYAGLIEVNKGNKQEDQSTLHQHEKYQVVKAAWDGIIDEKTFLTVQQMLDENYKLERARLSKSKKRFFSLSGQSVCGECGRALVGSTGHGSVKELRYYIHRPIEGKPVTCSLKRFNAQEAEDLVLNHLLHVLLREGYLNNVEKAIADVQLVDKNLVTDQKRDLERTMSQIDSEIKGLIRVQIQTEDRDLHEIYSSQLKENKDKKIQIQRQLDEVSLAHEKFLEPKEARKTIEEKVKSFQKAWGKSSPSLRKKLMRTVIHKLVFHPDSIDVFYNTDKDDDSIEILQRAAESTSSKLVDIAEKRFSKKMGVRNPPHISVSGKDSSSVMSVSDFYLNPPHNSKVTGWYIVKVGCGSWI